MTDPIPDETEAGTANFTKQTIRFVMQRNPEMSADEARAYIKRHVDDETERLKALASHWAPTDVHDESPIGVGYWRPYGSVSGRPDRCSYRLRYDRDRLTSDECFTVRIATIDVLAWSQARPKDEAGELSMRRTEAEYLRDALTAMLTRTE